MAADCNFTVTQEAIVDFLKANGGKVINGDLIEHFKSEFSEKPERKSAARRRFKTYVNNVAFVKAENGVKYVCLRRNISKEVDNFSGNGAKTESFLSRYAAGISTSDAADRTTPGSGYGSDDNQLRSRQSDEVDDNPSLSGSDGSVSPKPSRRHFLEAMMCSSPHLRHSLVLQSEGESVSLDDDRAPVTLEPLEHEWMLCASDGEWSSLQQLLSSEPSLILRRDFITGFTCLHWAAKHGKPELLALIVTFAKQRNIPISIDVRSNAGYTPLHVAVMHNHVEVIKLLVGAYSADVEVRDYSGKKACQYVNHNIGEDIKEIIGACPENAHCEGGAQSRFSKVLQSNLRFDDPMDAEVRLLRRKSSFSRMKPKLERLRRRASQIVHSTTFHEQELEGSEQGSFKFRPKTQMFG